MDCCEDYSDIYIFADDAKFFKHILIRAHLEYAVIKCVESSFPDINQKTGKGTKT